MKADTFNFVVLAVILFALSLPLSSMATSTRNEVSTEASPSGWSAHPMIYFRQDTMAAPTGLNPTQIRAAYNLPSTGGRGTIAIVDAYDDPTALNDLNVFSAQFNLPLLNSSNFEKHMMIAGTSVNGEWAVEISLDVQWAHAIAPNAKILLVEANTNSFSDLFAAIDYARSRSDVVAVSMSWGGNEFSTESSFDYHFNSSYGAAFFASSGDSGAGVSWPAASSNVIAVGGTFLNFSAGGSVTFETGWTGSGGGISTYEAEPPYQMSYNILGANGKRCVPDVSYDADPRSGVAVYDSTPSSGKSGWWQVGGTSAGSPQWAAIQSLGLSVSNDNLYQDANSTNYSSYLRDITAGSNGAYTAKAGYDLVTGLGSPLTTNYTPTATPSFSLSTSPGNLTIKAGNSLNSTVTATPIKGFNGTISLTASAPTGLNVTVTPPSLTITQRGSNSSTLNITVPPSTQAGTYTITVTGTNGSLSRTATITVNVQTVPSAPQNLLSTAGNGLITLSWSAPSSSAPVTNYNVYRGTSSGNETLFLNVGNTLNYTDKAVTNGQIYYYQITAINPVGESQKSNESHATPPNNTKTINITITTNKATYSKESSVAITITVKDNATGNPLRGANVNVTAYNPNGSVAWKSLGTITTLNGKFPITYTMGKNSPTGTYKIVATATYTGYQTATAQTTFSAS